MICKNCGEIISGNFCNHCGQKTSVSKITLSSLMNELSVNILQFDRGILHTIKALTISPGKTIQDYLEGKRKNHFKPISYLLFFSTLYFFVSKLTNQPTFLTDAINGFTEGASDVGRDANVPDIILWFSNNYAYTSLLLIPIFSLATFLSFKKYSLNYLEHIVLICYITGHQAIIYTLFCLFKSVVDLEILEMIPLVLAMTYCFWVFSQLFKTTNRIFVFLRTVLAYVINLILTSIALIIILGFYDLL